MNDKELQEAYDFAVQLGKDAGAMLMDAARARFGTSAAQKSVEKERCVCGFFFVLVLVLVNLPLPDPICAVIPIGWLSVHGIANKYHGYGLAVDTPAGPPGSLSAVDIVTETDFKVEEFIRTTIAKKYPSHG